MVDKLDKENDKQLWLSHSKITAYVECPLYYKLTYIDKVPLDVKGNYHTALGNGIHKVLEEMYKQEQYSLKFLEEWWNIVCYEGYEEKNGQRVEAILKDEQYDFPNGEEEKTMLFYHGRKLLREYYHKNKHEFGIAEIIATELNFKIPIANGKIVLNGYIDRIDRMPDGKLRICDYKTGKEKTQEEVDNDYQLTMYSFAVRKMFGEAEGYLYLHYIKSGNKIISTRGKEDFDKLRERIIYVKNGIENQHFEPRIGELCRYCLYDCPINGNKKNKS